MANEALQREVTIGVLTALTHEDAALCCVLEPYTALPISGVGGMLTYEIARVTSDFSGDHIVSIACVGTMGTSPAEFRAVRMKQDFPNLRYIIVCGIAGAVPNPKDGPTHVRLGDVVILNHQGVIQYDYGKETSDGFQLRPLPRAPAPRLLEAATHVQAQAERGRRPWEDIIDAFPARHGPQWGRPNIGTDVLHGTIDPDAVVQHPNTPGRRTPEIFQGPIASANRVQRNPATRDRLRDDHGIRAVEMEGAGVAEAAYQTCIGYFVIRGTCDYCDSYKNDVWHRHAAVVAAAYCKVFIQAIPVETTATLGPNVSVAALAQALVDAGQLMTEKAAGFQARLQELLDVLEYVEARRLAADVETFLRQHEHTIPAASAAQLYALLARVFLTADLNVRADISRAQAFIEKAKAFDRTGKP